MRARDYDVVILGGGIAGGLLCRHLRLAHPELKVLVLEQAQEITNFKVGESTVEVAAHYMVRRLDLGPYLYQHQLPKNGLRFFFDDEAKSLPLLRMSEIGADHFPYHPSFQLERAALERDLARMNVESGADVELGAKVTSLAVGKGGARHEVTFEKNGETRTVSGRWLADATGRRHLLPRTIGQRVEKETRLPTAAAWGRYRGVKGLDAPRDDAWRARVRFTSRHLSTNHLMYDGYWIWFIPLAGDLMSVGVVYDKERLGELRGEDALPRTQEAFEAFLREHRAARDLMEGAVVEDFQAYAHLPYTTSHFFDAEDRWFLTGEAGAFTDPFYSPGSDFIATANELGVALLEADLRGEAPADQKKRADAYDAFYKLKYETTLRLYAKLYPTFGSYEIFRLKFLLDFNNYYNLVTWPFMAGRITDPAWLEGEIRLADRILQAQDTMANQFASLAERRRASGGYFAENEGRFSNGLLGVADLERRLGTTMDEAFRSSQLQRNFGSVFGAVLEKMTGEVGLATREKVLDELSFPMVLLFKEINDESLRKFLDRVGQRMKKELLREFPGAAIEKVEIPRAAQAAAPRVTLGGELAANDAERARAIEARAIEMWNARGETLTEAPV